jgi:H/ACA ribonucleoprotein complex subunit 4
MEPHLLPFEKILRKEVVKQEAVTSEKFGCRPDDRKIGFILNYGIINISKPQGPTSHQVSEYVQKILDIRKSGHSGTLDPNVHGILPVAIGRATRIVHCLLKSGKEYVGIMHLHRNVEEKKLKDTIKKHFIGNIKQIPPLKSAVRRIKRTREIYYLDVLEIEEKDILFRVGCEAGTYIRKLCYDLGQKLRVGANMQELRRTRVGPFDESTAFTLQDLSDASYFYKSNGNEKFLRKLIQPPENAVKHLPKIWVFDTTVDTLCHGANLNVPGISKINDQIKEDDNVAIMTLKDELIALGTARLSSEDIMEKEKGLAVKTDKVFMEAETYKIDLH